VAKVAIIGCGAMGSVYAALMASHGHEVHAVTLWAGSRRGDGEARPAGRGRQRRPQGAAARGHHHRRHRPVRPGDHRHQGLRRRGRVALGGYAAAAGHGGAGDPERAGFGRAGGADRGCGPAGGGVVGGFGASLRAPGHVHHNGMEMVRFGSFAGLPRERLAASAAIWESAGFKVALFDDLRRMVWEKLIMNVTFSGTCCLTGMTIGEVMANADAWRVAALRRGGGGGGEGGRHPARSRRADRAHPQARRQDRQRAAVDAARSPGAAALRDRRDQRLDPREGARFGVPTPVNDTVVALVKAREAGFSA